MSGHSGWTTAPLVLLLSVAVLPIAFIAGRFLIAPAIDASSLLQALAFALLGATVAALVGSCVGAAAGTLELPGRRGAIALSAALIAAPPAFWWIGFTRASNGVSFTGSVAASLVAGVALSPVTIMLVLAATREIPSSAYEAARVALPPARRCRAVLLPMLRPAIVSGFLLSVVLLLGESELPFLFGFRTAMTDVVTTFSQTFDAGAVVPIVLPLVLAVVAAGVLLIRPLFTLMLPGSRGGRGVLRRRGSVVIAAGLYALPVLAALSLTGYVRAAFSDPMQLWRRPPADAITVIASVCEPVLCAFAAVGFAVAAAYPARRAPATRSLAVIGLLVFCVPAALLGIGWIALGQAVGGVAVPPAVAYIGHAIGLPLVAFVAAYARLPVSLEDAARLVAISPVRRAWTLVLPMIALTLAAASALVAALTFEDRDVSSLLLRPGESRLMLNLYLASANAPAAVIGGAALVAIGGGALAIALAAAGPATLWIRRR